MTGPGTAAARRSRVLGIGISTSVLSRGLAALVPLLVVPIGLSYLGVDGYGAWATALSLSAFLGFADFGLGTGLMTRLGHESETLDGEGGSAVEYVSSTYLFLAGVVTVGLLLLWGTAPFVDWAAILGASSSQSSSDVELIVLVTLTAFLVSIVTSLIVRVQYGVQQIGRSNVWQAAASLATLLATWGAARLDLGVGFFIAAVTFAPIAVAVANALVFFGFNDVGRRIAPKPSAFHPGVLGRLMGLGIRFFVISVLMTLSLALDPWIVARTTGIADVPSYSIPFRVFALIGTIGMVLTIPLWPLHAQAVASGDVAWIRRITRKMSVLTPLAIGAASLVAVVVGPWLMSVWIGGQVPFVLTLWIGLALWSTVQGVTAAGFMVQNGAEVLAPQTIGYLALLVALPLKWWVSMRFGFAWIPFVGTALYLVLIWPACLIGYRRSLAKATFVAQPQVLAP